MNINLIVIGTRMPAWVQMGTETYLSRMPSDYRVNIIEIAALKRTKNADIATILAKESALLWGKSQPHQLTITLDRTGDMVSTSQLAEQLQYWHEQQQDVNFLIGGPEGLHPDYLKKARVIWSLSKLTLPHPLVRILIAEQLYRAYSMIINHPYHRA